MSGKIDRKNLPEIPLGNGGKVEKSSDPVENWLLALASTVLNVPGMGYEDRFTSVSDSVTAAKFVSAIRQASGMQVRQPCLTPINNLLAPLNNL